MDPCQKREMGRPKDRSLAGEKMQFMSEMVIFEDTVALFAYDDELTIVKIENKNFADTFRIFFEALWSQGKRT